MKKPEWKPWHKVVTLRNDVKSGELSLAVFAADLYDVMMGTARPVYQDPKEFFALTYPTFNLRELAKDVVKRLLGQNEKAIRQLELTYGGGKTHTLITLYHLVKDPDHLPRHPSVEEFIQHIGDTPPQARIAVLSFDKLDVEKGMEVVNPKGERRWLKHPWSVLAWQIAGAEGLRLLNADNKDEERESAPAENLLVQLISMPGKEGLSTLILIDEVLMYVREKVGLDPSWRGKIINFFQYLTQALTKVDRAALVASLLATDPSKSDTLGKELTSELHAIFRREREEGVQPVVKEDVAEVLRRRFFTAESLAKRDTFVPHVLAALKGIANLDEQTGKDMKAKEERYGKSYPFHPDLTEIFYTKWTNLESFQRTRGILRTFALALRDSESHDECPIIGVNVFLNKPGTEDISEAARELTNVATSEEYEGKKQEWSGILQGELAKAREIEHESSGLNFREMEQAVFATFLHSQPIGQKALTKELFLLLGATRPDKIELEKALKRWTEISWFLDEQILVDMETGADGSKKLPKTWRLGSKPNLRQMHHDACKRVAPELIDFTLDEEIRKQKMLSAGAKAMDANVHTLPDHAWSIGDDGNFRFAILGPSAASESGKPSVEARRFIDETTGPDKPRVYRNAIVCVVPSRDGLDAARTIIREFLGWKEVETQLKDKDIDETRKETLKAHTEEARKKIPEAILQAYCIVVTVSEKNEIQAFKITVGGEPVFNTIKNDQRSRIQETSISAEALLPEGPYDLWREDEKSRMVKDLVGAFAERPHLPKMLRPKQIFDTLSQGIHEGNFILRSQRPDKSIKTYWFQEPDEAALKDPASELVLPQHAQLSDISYELMVPGKLPNLWDGDEINLRKIIDYFSGNKTVKIAREGYEEPFIVPKAGKEAVEAAVKTAVLKGKLWMLSGPASIFGEEIPAGLLAEDSLLLNPPQPISPMSILPTNLPEAWTGDITTALAISVALSKKQGRTLPWLIIREVLSGAFKVRILERTEDSGHWPCDGASAGAIKIRMPQKETPQEPQPHPTIKKPGLHITEAELKPSQIQDIADVIGELSDVAAGYSLKFRVRIEVDGERAVPDEVIQKMNEILIGVTKELRLT